MKEISKQPENIFVTKNSNNYKNCSQLWSQKFLDFIMAVILVVQQIVNVFLGFSILIICLAMVGKLFHYKSKRITHRSLDLLDVEVDFSLN